MSVNMKASLLQQKGATAGLNLSKGMTKSVYQHLSGSEIKKRSLVYLTCTACFYTHIVCKVQTNEIDMFYCLVNFKHTTYSQGFDTC